MSFQTFLFNEVKSSLECSFILLLCCEEVAAARKHNNLKGTGEIPPTIMIEAIDLFYYGTVCLLCFF
jgi:hypothetical protein